MMQTLRRHSADHVTVADLFTKTAASYPNKIAVIFEDQRWTFKELDEYANKVGNHFRAVGLQKGDTVALFMENCPENLGIILGLCKIGVVWLQFSSLEVMHIICYSLLSSLDLQFSGCS